MCVIKKPKTEPFHLSVVVNDGGAVRESTFQSWAEMLWCWEGWEEVRCTRTMSGSPVLSPSSNARGRRLSSFPGGCTIKNLLSSELTRAGGLV